MNVRIVWVLVAIILIALGAWYILAHQNFTSFIPQSYISTTTSASNSSPAVPAPTLDESQVAASIVGTWQSTDDPEYSVGITSKGKWTDTYGSGATTSVSETGTYELFTSQNPDKDFTGVLVPGVVYVKVSEGSSVLYFDVLEASDANLQLSYLDRGNTLSFTKAQ